MLVIDDEASRAADVHAQVNFDTSAPAAQ